MKKLAQRIFNKKQEEHFISAAGTEVKILFSSENPSLLGKTMQPTAIELSPRGLRIEVASAIAIDSVLDVQVKLPNSPRTYNLTGNVRYRLPSRQGHYHVVLVLRERSDIRSDLKTWKANFEQNFQYSTAV